jgi:hypothetical protein
MYRFQTTVITTLFCVSLLVLSGSALAADDYIDYDHAADFSKIKTFQMADTSKGALAQADQLLSQRVNDQIVQHLTTLGFQQVTTNGDQVVTFDASTKQNHELTTVGAPMGPVGVRFGMGWRRFGGMGMATTRESTFTEGTLVVDAYTPSGKQMLWRGIAEASVSENPEKTSKNVTRSLDKLFTKLAKVISP